MPIVLWISLIVGRLTKVAGKETPSNCRWTRPFSWTSSYQHYQNKSVTNHADWWSGAHPVDHWPMLLAKQRRRRAAFEGECSLLYRILVVSKQPRISETSGLSALRGTRSAKKCWDKNMIFVKMWKSETMIFESFVAWKIAEIFSLHFSAILHFSLSLVCVFYWFSENCNGS